MTSTAPPLPDLGHPPATGGAVLARRSRTAAAAAGPAALAAGVALLVAALHWKGVDQAAQAYRVAQVRDHGLALWDSGWYGGNYPLGYSLLFPVIGAVVGLTVTGAAAAATAAWAFDRLVTGHLGRRPLGVWYFAVSTMLPVAIGQLPYLAGECLGLAALVAATRQRRAVAGVLVALAAACSPLAAAFAVLACLAWARHDRARRPALGAVVAVAVVVVAAGGLAFPGTGPFPFPVGALVVVLLACALTATSLVATTPAVRTGTALYAAAAVASFVVANPLGGNAPRLLASVGVPLAVCLATARPLDLAAAGAARWTGLPARLDPGRWSLGRHGRLLVSVAALGGLAAWQWGPGLQVVTSPESDPAVAQTYYAPLVHQILARSKGPTRVEIPPTEEHWEAAWVAPYVSLARGWERQLDIADNPIFYRPGTLDAPTYERWLVANGVTWVALPATALDYAGKAEGGLLRTGEVRDLKLVWSNRHWKLWRVKGSPGLVSGPATLDQLGPGQADLAVSRPGVVTVRIRYSSYAAVSEGDACVADSPAGWTVLRVERPGPVTLSSSLVPDRSRCPAG
jgi:hypothetical protein